MTETISDISTRWIKDQEVLLRILKRDYEWFYVLHRTDLSEGKEDEWTIKNLKSFKRTIKFYMKKKDAKKYFAKVRKECKI